MATILSISAVLVATTVIGGFFKPVTDELIGEMPFASQEMLSMVEMVAAANSAEAKKTAEQALEKSIILTESLLGLELDRAQNRLTAARDAVDRNPRNRDAQTDLTRAETQLRQIEDRIKRYEEGARK